MSDNNPNINNNILIKEFDMKSLKDHKIILVQGKRGSGKSFLIKDILYNKRDFERVLAVSFTEPLNKFYQKFIPDSFIYSDFNSNKFNKILNYQKKDIILNGIQPDNTLCILFDDCLSEEQWKKDKGIKEIFFNGRNMCTTFIADLQYIYYIHPGFRSNADYIFIFHDPDPVGKKKIYDTYGGYFGDYKTFCLIYDEVCQNQRCLVIDRTKNNNKLENCIFFYKAKYRESFRLGSDLLWKYHTKKYDRNYILRDDSSRKIKELEERYGTKIIRVKKQFS
jgi:hypothetical protein